MKIKFNIFHLTLIILITGLFLYFINTLNAWNKYKKISDNYKFNEEVSRSIAKSIRTEVSANGGNKKHKIELEEAAQGFEDLADEYANKSNYYKNRW